eukprot:3093256-Pyramimonas_sp.AAC.1
MGVHLASGIGLTGADVDELIQMGQLIQGIRTLWLFICDFNAKPHKLGKIVWPRLVDGIIWAADGFDCACTLGKKCLAD